MSAATELESLIARYLDGTAGRSEAEELAARLANDPEAAARFAAACRTDFALSGHFECEASAVKTRHELAGTIAKAERRDSTAARAEARKARGAAVAARYRRSVRPALRAAAILVLLAVAAYALWPDAKPPVIAGTGSGTVKTSETRRVALPDGQPPRVHGRLAMREDMKRKLSEFHLPDLSIDGQDISGAIDTILQQYNDIASAHGIPAIDVSAVRVAKGVNMDAVVSLALDSSIPVSTALTAAAVQAGARLRYTGDGVVVEPFAIAKPDEIVSREFRLSENAFRWMSEGASTSWAAAESGVQWDAGHILRTYGISLENEDARAVYFASDQKLEVTTTRENASRIDALRQSAEAAGKNQILLHARIIELPLEIESADLGAQLPALVQTESLISDPEFQVIARAAQQMKGASVLSMPSAVSIPGSDVEINSTPQPNFAMGYGEGQLLNINSIDPTGMVVFQDTVQTPTQYISYGNGKFIQLSGGEAEMGADIGVSGEGGKLRADLSATEEIALMNEEMHQLEIALVAQEEGANFAVAAAAQKAGQLQSGYEAMAVEEGQVIGYVTTEGNEATQTDLEMVKRDLTAAKQGTRISAEKRAELLAEVDAMNDFTNEMETEIADYYNKSAQFQQLHGNSGRQQACANCHQSNTDVDRDGQADLAVSYEWKDFVINSMNGQACPAAHQANGPAPALNLSARFEGHRIRVEGEVSTRSNPVNAIDQWVFQSLDENARSQFTIDLNLQPEVVEFNGFINYSPSPAAKNVVEFDAVLADGEILMLEVSRDEDSRTLVFLEAKKLRAK